MANINTRNQSKLTDQERDQLSIECGRYKFTPKMGFGTSYTSKRACEVSSLYGIEGGDHVSTLVSKEGKPISMYIMGKESTIYTK